MILVGIVIIVIGIGWVMDGNNSSSTKVDLIRVGVIESLSGPAAYYGEQNKKGIDLAIVKLKEKYPKVDFVAMHEDSKYNAKDGLNAYNKLKVDGGIDAVITHGSPVAIAIQPVAAQDKILQMAVSASVADYSSANDLSFRVSPKTDIETKVMAEYLAKQNLQNIGILYYNNDIGVSVARDFTAELGKLNTDVKVVSSESYPLDTNDYRSYLLKVKNLKTDGLYVIGTAAHMSNIIKQARELDIQASVFGFRPTEDPVLLKNLGQLAEGIIYTYGFDTLSTVPPAKQFTADYKQRYSELPDGFAAEGYEGMRLVGEAFAKCGKDNDCIKNFLLNLKDYDSIFGKISFDRNGDILYPFFLKTVKDGKFLRLE